MRRLASAGRYPGHTEGVLPDPLRHLHAILTYESALSSAHASLRGTVASASGPTPACPPLSELVAAYRALDQGGLARVAQAVQEAAEADTLEQQSEALAQQFRTAMAERGLAHQRRTYARSHRDGILPR